ncbi:MAG: sulfotransferase [Planctomycetes bacterium]|nr:sulfotransferase [Planctomycetota bacterium]
MDRDAEIIVVSGLPRSGTSLMMQMLVAGGVQVVADGVRGPDADNPRGYFELEMAKRIRSDTSWLPQMRGKAFKLVSQLLYQLPRTERYRIIFMQRNLNEVLISQEIMLRHRNAPVPPRDQIKAAYTEHLKALFTWMSTQANMLVLTVNYNDLLDRSLVTAEQISVFLAGRAAVQAMTQVVEPALYRVRKRA